MAHPSSKYDAAGGGGIINIVTKKNFTQGLNASVNLGYRRNVFRPVQSGGRRFGQSQLPWEKDQHLPDLQRPLRRHEYDPGLPRSLYGENYDITMSSRSNLLNSSLNQMFRAGNDWYINERNILGVIVNGTFPQQRHRHLRGQFHGATVERCVLLGDELMGRLESDIDNSDCFNGISANLNYTHTFDKAKAQELTVNADYSYFDILNRSSQSDIPVPGLQSMIELDSNIFRQNASQKLQIWSVKADYQQVFWQTGLLEAGLKWSRTITDNNSVREDFLGNSWLYSDSLSNLFMYDEQIAAAYISAAKSFGPKWSVKIGLRGEYTYARGDWRSAGEQSVKSYFNLFPTAFISYMPTQKWRLAASYTRRISRPGYSQLNPFRSYMSANSYTEGDPNLDPQFSDQVSLTVGYGQHLNLSLMYQHNSNLIMQHPEVNPDNGEQRLIWENFGTQSLAGAALSVSELPITKWLNFSANYFAAYNGNTSTSGGYSDGSFLQSFYGNLTFLLPKGMENRGRRLRLRQYDHRLHEYPPDVHALRRHQEEPLGRPGAPSPSTSRTSSGRSGATSHRTRVTWRPTASTNA